MYAHVLGEGENGGPRAPCYAKLERAVLCKKKGATKKASDKCAESNAGPKIADVAAATGVSEQDVTRVLLGLRANIKNGCECAKLLATATAALREGEGGGAGSTATAAVQPANASLNSSSYGEDATEGAEAGGQSAGAGETGSPTTTTAGRADVGAGGYRKGTTDAALFGQIRPLLPGALKSIKPGDWSKIFQLFNWDADNLPVVREDGYPEVDNGCREQAAIKCKKMVALLNQLIYAEGFTARDHVFLRRLLGCLEQAIHRDAKHGLAVILAMTDGYTVRLYPGSEEGAEAAMDAQLDDENP